MKYFLYVFVTAAVLISASSCASRTDAPDTNFLRDLEAYEELNGSKVPDLVGKPFKSTQDSAGFSSIRERVLYGDGALVNAVRALDCAIRKCGGKQQKFLSSIYSHRGRLFSNIKCYDRAAESYYLATKYARKDNPAKVEAYLVEYGRSLYGLEEDSAAVRILGIVLEINPANSAAMICMSRCRMYEGRLDEALEWYTRAESAGAQASYVYRYGMELKDAVGDTTGCVDAAMKYYELENDANLWLVVEYTGKHYTYAVSKAEECMADAVDARKWIHLLCTLYENNSNYAEALALYEIAESRYGFNASLSRSKARCRLCMGDKENSLMEINRAIDLSGDNRYLSTRADIYKLFAEYDKAIEDYKTDLKSDSNNSPYYNFYSIGWCYEMKGDWNLALEYYNRGIELNAMDIDLLSTRADLLTLMDRREEASKDYRKVLELDTEKTGCSRRHYALQALGQEREAEEWIDGIIEADPFNGGIMYDKACLMVRMGRLDDAMNALESAFSKGFRLFEHMEHDNEMDALRDLPRYKAMLKKYRTEAASE